MIAPGTVAWANVCPGFSPPKEHPLLVAKRWPGNGLVGMYYITHSIKDARAKVVLTEKLVPHAFRQHGGPLTDEDSGVLIIDSWGDNRMVNAEVLSHKSVRVGAQLVDLSFIVQLPDDEWERLRLEILNEITAAQAKYSANRGMRGWP